MGKVKSFKHLVVKGLLIPLNKYKGDGKIDTYNRIMDIRKQ